MVISLGWLSPAISCGLPAARTTRAGSRCLFGLAPTGGCRAAPVTGRAVGSYPTVSPLPFGYKGGLFSVALSVALRRPGVTWRSALWSSDFPRVTPKAGHPRPSAPPLPGEEITGPQGHGARLYFVKRRITRPKLSVAAPSSQNPACSLNAANRNRGHSLCANVARSGCKPRAESANTLRSR